MCYAAKFRMCKAVAAALLLVAPAAKAGVLWTTGSPNPVIYNGNPTNLGFSSGNLGAGSEQRWAAVPFRVEAPAAIDQIDVNFFVPDGADFDNAMYVIWNRNGLAAPVDGDQFSAGVLGPGAAPGEPWLHQYPINVPIPRGDYYLTVYGDGSPAPNNLAWFTGGDLQEEALEQDFLYRAAQFPSPGFQQYAPASIQPPAGMDPQDVWNLSFTLYGEEQWELFWDGNGPGNWNVQRWEDDAGVNNGDVPDVGTNTKVLTDVVTVAAPAAARRLAVETGGVNLAGGQTLEVAIAADFQPGTTLGLGPGATLKVGTGGLPFMDTGGAIHAATGDGEAVFDVASGRLDLDTYTYTGAGDTLLIKRGDGTLAVGNLSATAKGVQTMKIEAGELVTSCPDPLGGAAEVELAGGRLTIDGQDTLTDDILQGFFYDVPVGQPGTIEPLDDAGGVMTGRPGWIRPLTEPLDFRNNTLQAYAGVPEDDYASVWHGFITIGGASPLPAGDVSFGMNSDDGNVLYIDLDGDGNFSDGAGSVDLGELIVADNVDHGFQNVAGDVNLAAGTYRFATAFYERGGGDGHTVRFGAGAGLAYGDMTIVNPADAAQAGIWAAVVAGPIDLPGATIRVTESSTLNGFTGTWAFFGGLVLENGALTTDGAPKGVRFGGTSIHPAATAVGIDPQVPTDFGTVDGHGAQVVFSKVGSGSHTFRTANTGLQNATIRVEDGSLKMVGLDPWGGSTQVELAGGRLTVQGDEVLMTNTLQGSVFTGGARDNALVDGIGDGTGTGGLLGKEPVQVLSLSSRIDYRSDADFRYGNQTRDVVGFSALGQNDDYQSLFVGQINAPFSGDYEFGTNRGDDPVRIYVDLNNNGVFETDAGEQIVLRDCCGNAYNTVHLDAGTYAYAAAQHEYGGGSQIEPTIQWPGGNRVTVDPGDPAQNGLWAGIGFAALDLSTHSVTVNAAAELETLSDVGVSFGPLTLGDGAILTTLGGPLSFRDPAKGPDTTIDPAAGAVGIDSQAPTDLGLIDGSGAGAVISKYGDGNLVLDQANVNLAGSVFHAQGGRLIARPAPGEKAEANPFEQAGILIGGGEVVLSGLTTDGVAVYDTAVEIVADGAITAGAGGNATTGVAVTLGSPAKATGVTLTDGVLTLGSNDGYSLNVAGELAGSGGVRVEQGAVTVSGGGTAGTLRIVGGEVNLQGQDLSVDTLSVSGGLVDTGAGRVTVNETLRLGPTTFDVTGGTVQAAGPDLANADVDCTVTLEDAGSRVTVTGGGVMPDGLRLWLDAGDAGTLFQDTAGTNPVTMGGQQVALWKDKSGLGLDVSEATNTPDYVAAAANLNNAPALHFTGGQDTTDVLRRVNDTGILGNADRTVITVWANGVGTGQNYQHAFHMGNPANNRAYGHSASRGGDAGDIGNHYWGAGYNSTATSGLGAANLAISTWDGDGGTGGGGLDSWYVNGAAVGTSDRAPLDTGADQLSIGSRINPYTEGINGDIAEVFVFDRVLTGGEINDVGGYLTGKYGLPTPYTGGIGGGPADSPHIDVVVGADLTMAGPVGGQVTLGDLTLLEGAAQLQLADAAFGFGDVTTPATSTINGTLAFRDNLNVGGDGVGLLMVSGSGGFEFGEEAVYNCQIAEWDSTNVPDPWDPVLPTGPINDKVLMTAGDALLGGSLELTAVAKLHPPVPLPGQPGVTVEWYGDQDRTIMGTGGDNTVLYTFDSATDAQPDVYDLPGTGNWGQGHIGHGVFLKRQSLDDPVVHLGLSYDTNSTGVHLFQAADGDTNGDRLLDSLDIQAILSANTFPNVQPADWHQGDFNADGWCNGLDVQALLATGLYPFLPGPYAAIDPGDPGDRVVDLLLYANDFAGSEEYPAGEAGTLVLSSDGVTINGYVIRSAAGIFNGEPANNLGWFAEDSDRQISGNMGFTLSGLHKLAKVVGPHGKAAEVNPFDDLTFTYTIQGVTGTFVGNLIVIPEPGTAAMFTVGLLACLVWTRRRRRR